MQFSTKEEGMKKHSENWQEGGGKEGIRRREGRRNREWEKWEVKKGRMNEFKDHHEMEFG